MKTRTLFRTMAASWLVLAVMLIFFEVSRSRQARAADKDQQAAVGDFKLSGPFSHENLTIFLIHGEDRIDGKKILTLQEGLEQKKVVIHETGNVNELAIENVSKDEEIFIQSGDILKGGRQDRLISFSMILAAQSGKVPVAVFCVEHGRWQQRGKEAAGWFTSSTSQLPSKALKVNGGAYAQLGGNMGFGGGNQGFGGGTNLGAGGGNQGFGSGNQGFGGGTNLGAGGGNQGFGGGNQGGVWTEVTAFQNKLMANAGVEVRAKESPTSLQLTLENKKVKETVDRYTEKLASILNGRTDVIGYAFAINGKVNSAEVYGSAALFKNLWPKLLRANATEALAELQKGKQFDPVTADAVKTCLLDANTDKTQRDYVAIQKTLAKRTIVLMRETEQSIFLETRDREQEGGWIHRTYVTK